MTGTTARDVLEALTADLHGGILEGAVTQDLTVNRKKIFLSDGTVATVIVVLSDGVHPEIGGRVGRVVKPHLDDTHAGRQVSNLKGL